MLVKIKQALIKAEDISSINRYEDDDGYISMPYCVNVTLKGGQSLEWAAKDGEQQMEWYHKLTVAMKCMDA